MADPDIHRIMETCLRRQAQEVWLMAGQPPLLRMSGVFRELSVPPLRAEEVSELAIEALAPQYSRTYREHGKLGFDYPYPHQTGLWFRVLVVKSDASDFATLTPITEPTPPPPNGWAKTCAVCGYDLRGTPERCPECGTVPKGVA